MKENVTFIQYELLFSDKEIHIEKLKHIAPAVLKRLFEKINDPELYALALLDVDIATKRICARSNEYRVKNKSGNRAFKNGKRCRQKL